MPFWIELLFRKKSKNNERVIRVKRDNELSTERHKLLELEDRKQYSEFMLIESFHEDPLETLLPGDQLGVKP